MIQQISDNLLSIRDIFSTSLLAGSQTIPRHFAEYFDNNGDDIIDAINEKNNLSLVNDGIHNFINDIINNDVNLIIAEFVVARPFGFKFDAHGVILNYNIHNGSLINQVFCCETIQECVDEAIAWKSQFFSSCADEERKY